MKKKILITFLLALVGYSGFSCSRIDENLNEDEVLIYSTIIDSLFDNSYEEVFINDSTLSLIRFIQKNSLSEHLFGKKPVEYVHSFFKEKECVINEGLIEPYIANNREKYSVSKLELIRKHKFVPYISIYAYTKGYTPKNKDIKNAMENDLKFGIVSFSRISFAENETEALVEINVHRPNRGETFFSILKKVNETWQFSSNCYLYGPYKVKP